MDATEGKTTKKYGRGKGKPTKLNEKLIRQICKLIQIGATYEVATRAYGVSRSTFYNWRKRGEKATSGIFKKLQDELDKAEAVAEVAMLYSIKEQGAEGAKWILQRRWPERWNPMHERKPEVPDPLPWNEEDDDNLEDLGFGR